AESNRSAGLLQSKEGIGPAGKKVEMGSLDRLAVHAGREDLILDLDLQQIPSRGRFEIRRLIPWYAIAAMSCPDKGAGPGADVADSRMGIHVFIIVQHQPGLERGTGQCAVFLTKARDEAAVGARIHLILQPQSKIRESFVSEENAGRLITGAAFHDMAVLH